MSTAEFLLWGQFRQRFGFDIDRLENTIANGAAAQCRAWGARIHPEDIVAKFGREKSTSKKKLCTQMAGLPGARIRFIPNDPSKPIVTGRLALAVFDGKDDRPRRVLLSGGPKPRANRTEKRGTLSGD